MNKVTDHTPAPPLQGRGRGGVSNINHTNLFFNDYLKIYYILIVILFC